MTDYVILSRITSPGRFGPLTFEDPAVSDAWLCPVCESTFRVGQRPTLINGIPATVEDLLLAAEGRPYTGTASMAHEDCVWPTQGGQE